MDMRASGWLKEILGASPCSKTGVGGNIEYVHQQFGHIMNLGTSIVPYQPVLNRLGVSLIFALESEVR